MTVLKNPLLVSIIIAIIAGLSVAEFSILAPYIPYFIAFMLYFSFIGVRFDIKKILRMEIFIPLSLSGFIMPALAWYIFSYGQIDEYRTGMFLVSASPAGIAMLVIAKSLKKIDFDLVLGTFFITHFSLIFYLPVLVYLFQGNKIDISIGKLFFQTAVLISIPWFLASLTHRVFKTTALVMIKHLSNWLNPLMFFSVISSSLALARQQIEIDLHIAFLFFLVFLIYLTQSGLAFTAGIFFNNKRVRNSLTLSASSKNIQLTLGIAVLNYSPLTAVPIVLGIIAHHISNGLWIWLLTRKKDASEKL